MPGIGQPIWAVAAFIARTIDPNSTWEQLGAVQQ